MIIDSHAVIINYIGNNSLKRMYSLPSLMGRIMALQISFVEVLTSTLQNVNVFGERAFNSSIKVMNHRVGHNPV